MRLAGAASGSLRTVASHLQRTEEQQLEWRLAAARQALDPQQASRAVAEREAMSLDDAVAYALVDLTSTKPDSSERVLSPRELKVAELIGQGSTNAQIATRLVISEGTAKRHVENIMTKLDVHSRAQIVGWLATHRSAGR